MVAVSSCSIVVPSIPGIPCYLHTLYLMTSGVLIVALTIYCLCRLAWSIVENIKTRMQTHMSQYLNSASDGLERQITLYMFLDWSIHLVHLCFQASSSPPSDGGKDDVCPTRTIDLTSETSGETGNDPKDNRERNQSQSSELVDMLADSISEFEALQNRMLDVMRRALEPQDMFPNGRDDGLDVPPAYDPTCEGDGLFCNFEDLKKRVEQLVALRERIWIASPKSESGESFTPWHVFESSIGEKHGRMNPEHKRKE
ncbi:hypothetical protein PVAR5_8220 [Paecilomyces variotii No. 5]|uniref:Uncharacterized protein n=1 Tax=Byssochlamys spectabilis (strain No. 5 / NBRC 109023) TaxID=1356009 RepID=V5I5Q3_BYSSN|nr:hypothetical protein PVAR5_8220 [Paecilomyces variotii No. 5]